MGRKNEGTVRLLNGENGKQWHGKWTRADGTRSEWLPLPTSIPIDDRPAAKAYAAKIAPSILSESSGAKPGVETCDGWHERYRAYCTERGLSTVGDKFYRWRKWISPAIGAKPPAEVTRQDIEGICADLDAAILAGRIEKWKTASNVWGELTAAFREMLSSKRKDLQVLTLNPAAGVRPPEKGGATDKCYPYPSELLALLSAPETAVPQAWKEIHAVAAYSYLRPGELWVLDWTDVDLPDEKIHVTKAWDFKAKKIKSTKTGETRTIPIEPHLLPLLRAMHDRCEGKGLVVPTLAKRSGDTLATLTRRHFEAAGCKRPRLYKEGASERHVVFRSWRDAGITWSIVRGDDIVKVQRRAGHRQIATTMRYIIEAENRGATFGAPLGPLPPVFLESVPNRPGPIKTEENAGKTKASEGTCSGPVRAIPPTCEPESPRASTLATAPGDLTTDRGAELEAAIARLTRALSTADDESIADLVAERKAMRGELETLRRDPTKVIDLAQRRERGR